jgi:hypothetical protein
MSHRTAAATQALAAELAQRFSELGLRQILICLDQAQRDLDGSVSAECLPEMAARLAIYRLEGVRRAAMV